MPLLFGMLRYIVPSLPFLVSPQHWFAGYGGLSRDVYFADVCFVQRGRDPDLALAILVLDVVLVLDFGLVLDLVLDVDVLDLVLDVDVLDFGPPDVLLVPSLALVRVVLALFDLIGIFLTLFPFFLFFGGPF
jgi:hypothetical protein